MTVSELEALRDELLTALHAAEKQLDAFQVIQARPAPMPLRKALEIVRAAIAKAEARQDPAALLG